MDKLTDLVVQWVTDNKDNLDIWIKRERGEIVGIDMTRTDLEEPAEDPAPLKMPYIAQYAEEYPARKAIKEAREYNEKHGMKPLVTENEGEPE